MFDLVSVIWLLSGYIIAVAFLPLPFLTEFKRAYPAPDSKIDSKLLCIIILLILFGIVLRIYFAEIAFDGQLTADEIGMSRLYVYTVLSDGKYISGATQYLQGLMLSWWYVFFGLSAFSARMFTVICSLIGMIFYYKSVELFFGRRVGLTSTALISVSPYAIYFSCLALECNAVVFFMPVIIYQFLIWERNPDTVRSISLGLLIGLSTLTYPGHVLGLVCFFSSIFLFVTIKMSFKLPNSKLIKNCMFIIFSFILIMSLSFILHAKMNSSNKFLFAGGAMPEFSFVLYNLYHYFLIILGDLLIEVKSWYGVLKGAAIVEKSWLVLSLFGLSLVWKFDKRVVVRAFGLSMVLIVVVVPFTGHPMGIRRGLYVFIPLFAFAAIGIIQIIDLKKHIWLKFFLGLAVLHTLFYDMLQMPKDLQKPYATGFCMLTIPDKIMQDNLEVGDIFLNVNEFNFYIDRDLNSSYAKLLQIYYPEKYTNNLTFAKLEDIKLSDSEDSKQIFLTWNPHLNGIPPNDKETCIDAINIKIKYFSKDINLLKLSVDKDKPCKASLSNFSSEKYSYIASVYSEFQSVYGELVFLPWCNK